MNDADLAAAARELRVLFDARGYLDRYPDVRATGMDPVEHYLRFGAAEGRQPCALFDGAWYVSRYGDIAAAGLNPLLHYIRHGGMEMRDPCPGFNAAYYVDEHPEAVGNPLLYHLLVGEERGFATEPPLPVESLLPSALPPRGLPAGLTVDVVIPVYRGYAQTVRCIESVMADADRPPGRVLVIDDCSPEPRLSGWLRRMAKEGRIELIRNARNLGFVRSVNRGMKEAGRRDVVLLNSDTEVPAGWLARLAGAAYADDNVATASPLSNNATICSWPSVVGGVMPDHLTLDQIDAGCRAANAGRIVDLPTTVGFCMYIRRAALDAVGAFDARAFGHGYGEEADFCRRAAARGWRHVLAADTFVYHEGEVSFGAQSRHAAKAQATMLARHPEYAAVIARFVRIDPVLPARLALTAALFRQNRRPGILFVSHAQGGGVRRQMREVFDRLRGKANVMLLQPGTRGVVLSVPELPDHPVLELGPDRVNDLALYLRSAGMSRVHIHHLMDMPMDIRALIRRLDVPFDVTVHDYFAICPHVNLLPRLDAQYCGEPDARTCNACIAATPNGAADIDSWRWQHAWLLREAARVICPSADARARLHRLGLARPAIVAPHEAGAERRWQLSPPRADKVLRVALLGVLADRKGLATVEAVAEAADDTLDFHLIGHPEADLPPALAARLDVSGAYEDAALPALIARRNPHVFWFPAQWPETYSYTLSAAIAAGGAIVASNLGAFAERLKGRPLTWLVPADAPPAGWLAAFAAARKALSGKAVSKRASRAPVADFYAEDYLRPPRSRRGAKAARVLVLPERLDNGGFSPCAHIRLLQPLHHPAIAAGQDIRIGSIDDALASTPDVIVTQRHAIPDPAMAARLTGHCRAHGIRLIYDLDDDVLDLPDDHPDAFRLRPLVPAVQALLRGADEVWVSTSGLADRLPRGRRKPRVLANALDERLFWPPPALDRPLLGPLRLLYMGTGTHAADLEMALPALERLASTFGERIAIDVVGVTPHELPPFLHRVPVPHIATRSYPAFINWLSGAAKWHIGLAPLADTAFNRSKSAIKSMDYAGIGIPTVASAIGVYETALQHGENGLLVGNTPSAWYAALAALVRDPARLVRLTAGARVSFARKFSLAAQAKQRRAALFG